MIKHILKFFAGGVVIAVLGWLAVLGLRYWATQNDPETKIMKQMEALQKQYAEDPYGGETPEETLRLFIDALKKGDIELATKYFVIDEQKKWREQLEKIKEKGLLGEMVKDMERLKRTDDQENEVIYTTINKDDIVSVQLVLKRMPLNKRWKIYEI